MPGSTTPSSPPCSASASPTPAPVFTAHSPSSGRTSMTSPETLELEAVDAALAGRYVAPEHAELADLALLLRDDRPQPTLAWTTHLDRRVEAGFPARPRKRRDWGWLRQAAPVFAILAVIAPLAVLGALNAGSGDNSNVSSGGSSGAGGGASTAADQAAPTA